MIQVLRGALAPAIVLLLFAVVASTLLAGTYGLTRGRIAATERAARQALVAQTLPGGSFDNDLVHDSRAIGPDPLLGLHEPGRAYIARYAGRPVAVVLEAVAPDGYSGEIKLLVGILEDGRVSGVRVTAHRETPGLGDYIDSAKSNWVRQFEGTSLDTPTAAEWKVRKDRGHFEHMAGATVTPRAIVKAVRKALEYHARHRREWLASVADAGAATAPLP